MVVKRVMDVGLGTIAGLAMAAPILAWAAVAMRLSGDRGPFLYRARRVGEGGELFTILKVRTMTARPQRLEADGRPGLPRVTKVGRTLRRYRLDELPQLVNVVRGDMSLVGPRPEDPAYVDLTDPLHRRVFSAKPGITGLAQLAYRDEAALLGGTDAEQGYREELLPAKLRLDAEYLDRGRRSSIFRSLPGPSPPSSAEPARRAAPRRARRRATP